MAHVGETSVDDHADVAVLLVDEKQAGHGLPLTVTAGDPEVQEPLEKKMPLAAVFAQHWVPIRNRKLVWALGIWALNASAKVSEIRRGTLRQEMHGGFRACLPSTNTKFGGVVCGKVCRLLRIQVFGGGELGERRLRTQITGWLAIT